MMMIVMMVMVMMVIMVIYNVYTLISYLQMAALQAILGRIRRWMHYFYSTKFGSSEKAATIAKAN